MKQTKRLYPTPVTNPNPGRWRAFRESPRGRKGIAGSSLVEFAYVVPLMLTLVMAMFVFCIAMNQYLTLTNATMSGAQALATARGQTSDPCNTAVLAVEAASPTLTQSSLTFYFSFNGGSLVNESSCASQTLVEGQNAEVEVTYPCKLTVMAVNFAPSCKLTAETAEAIE